MQQIKKRGSQKKVPSRRNDFARGTFTACPVRQTGGSGKGNAHLDMFMPSPRGHDATGAVGTSMKTARATVGNGLNRAASRADPLGTNSEIGRKLKQYYDDLVSESVPDRFQDLLRQLEDREQPTATAAATPEGD